MTEKPQLLRPSPHRVQLRNPLLHVPAVLELAERITDIPGVRYDEIGKLVEIPHTVWAFPDVQHLFELHQIAPPTPIINRFPGIWDSTKRPFFNYQMAGAEFLVERGGGLCADQLGCGKTSTAICAAETYMSQVARNPQAPRVVIGPKFLRKVWANEHAKVGAPGPFTWLEGRDVTKPFNTNALWYFVHYEIVEAWWSYLSALRPQVVICDEAHFVKSTKTARFKGTELAMMAAPLRIALTGTPILNKIAESHALLNLACGKWSWGNRTEYRKRYAGAVIAGFGGATVDTGPTNMNEFHARLGACYIRRTAEEVGLNLPMIMRQTVECDLDDEEARELQRALKGYSPAQVLDALYQSRLGKDTIEWTTKLRKTTSIVKIPHTVREVISDVEQGEHVVVFCWLKETVERICDELTNFFSHRDMEVPVRAVTGDYKMEVREAAVESFQERGGVIVATYDSLGVGVTLTKGRVIIMHDLEWVPAKMIQGEARVFRYSQTRNVISKTMVAPNTLDQRLAEVFVEKADIIAQALGDTDPLSFAELLKPAAQNETVEESVAAMLKSWN